MLSPKAFVSSHRKTNPRGRATLLFLVAMATFLMYLYFADSGGQSHGKFQDLGAKSSSLLSSISLPGFLGHQGLLDGSIKDEVRENPLEVLSAQLLSREPPVALDPPPLEREDPEPGNMTGRYHGVCRSSFPPAIPNITIYETWKSEKTRRYSDVTLMTHLSIDQLHKLERQCRFWKSTLAAAVFVRLPYGNESVEVVYDEEKVIEMLKPSSKEIQELFVRMEEEESACTLDVLLAYEEFSNIDPFLGLYPINSLRNLALQLSDTDVVLNLDVDLLPNARLSHDLHIVSQYETVRRVTEARQIIVLPALEIVGAEDDVTMERWIERSLEGYDRIVMMAEKGRVRSFQSDKDPLAQGNTRFDEWITSTMPYRIDDIEPGYQPYFLAKRLTLPWFDERYRGLKLNRAAHTWHLFQTGFVFVATPKAYVIHIAHEKSPMWRETRKRGFYKKMQKMYNSSLIDVQQDLFSPVTLFQCVNRRSNKWSWY